MDRLESRRTLRRRHADALVDLVGFGELALRTAADQQKLKNALDGQQLLTREMGHRLKNVLAVVQALLNMAVRRSGSASELAQKMSNTLQALSTAQNLVTSKSAFCLVSGCRLPVCYSDAGAPTPVAEENGLVMFAEFHNPSTADRERVAMFLAKLANQQKPGPGGPPDADFAALCDKRAAQLAAQHPEASL